MLLRPRLLFPSFLHRPDIFFANELAKCAFSKAPLEGGALRTSQKNLCFRFTALRLIQRKFPATCWRWKPPVPTAFITLSCVKCSFSKKSSLLLRDNLNPTQIFVPDARRNSTDFSKVKRSLVALRKLTAAEVIGKICVTLESSCIHQHWPNSIEWNIQ